MFFACVIPTEYAVILSLCTKLIVNKDERSKVPGMFHVWPGERYTYKIIAFLGEQNDHLNNMHENTFKLQYIYFGFLTVIK